MSTDLPKTSLVQGIFTFWCLWMVFIGISSAIYQGSSRIYQLDFIHYWGPGNGYFVFHVVHFSFHQSVCQGPDSSSITQEAVY